MGSLTRSFCPVRGRDLPRCPLGRLVVDERRTPRAPLALGPGGLPDAVAFSKTVGAIAGESGIDAGSRSSCRSTSRSSTAARTACASTSTAPSKAGVTVDIIAQLPVWRESGVFSDRERAGLELAEAFTFIHEEGVSDEVYDRVGRRPQREGVRRAQLDPRVDQRVQPHRDRRPLPACRRATTSPERTGTPPRARRGDRRRASELRSSRAPSTSAMSAGCGPARAARARACSTAPAIWPGSTTRASARSAPWASGGSSICAPTTRSSYAPSRSRDSTPRTQRVPLFLGSVDVVLRRRRGPRRDVPADSSSDSSDRRRRGRARDHRRSAGARALHGRQGPHRGHGRARARRGRRRRGRGRGRRLRPHRGAAAPSGAIAASSSGCGRCIPRPCISRTLATRSPAPVMRGLLAEIS